MVTNSGYDPARPAGSNWTNTWGQDTTTQAQRITFHFTNGATKVGIGCSNFQSVNPPSSDSHASLTNHRLLVNGVALPQDLETLAGVNWISGGDRQNGYVMITATAGTVIQSIGFESIQSTGIIYDALNFDVLGFDGPTTKALPATWGRLKMLSR